MLRVEDMTDQQKVDELHHWRGDAAARLRTAMILADAAKREGDQDEAARITVSIILPTRAALTSALTGDVLWPCCDEGCGKPLVAGDIVFAVGDEEGCQTGEVHIDCANPQAPSKDEAAYPFTPDDEFGPDGVEKTLAETVKWLDEAA